MGGALEPSERYYAITLLGMSDGHIEYACHSAWVGYDHGDPPREIRKGRLMSRAEASNLAAAFRAIGEYYLVVRNSGDLLVFYLAGGHAFIEKSLAESRKDLQDLLASRVVVRTGALDLVAADSLPSGSFHRSPTAKQRMRVLKRDDLRCRVCGRRATDYVDLELHVHHMRPWGKGGVTVNENLITLCHTCHNGLEPHEDWNLFELIAPSGKLFEATEEVRKYLEGVRDYRTGVLQSYHKMREQQEATCVRTCRGHRKK